MFGLSPLWRYCKQMSPRYVSYLFQYYVLRWPWILSGVYIILWLRPTVLCNMNNIIHYNNFCISSTKYMYTVQDNSVENTFKIISLRRELLAQWTSLIPSFCTEVPVACWESKPSFIYVLELSSLPFCYTFLIRFLNCSEATNYDLVSTLTLHMNTSPRVSSTWHCHTHIILQISWSCFVCSNPYFIHWFVQLALYIYDIWITKANICTDSSLMIPKG
jgi:hypothetical protein